MSSHLPHHRVTIDVVSKAQDGSLTLTLVEEGPWAADEITPNLRRVQERLYNCVDAAIDGQVAALYPQSKGKPVVIRLDCYDTPDTPVREFIDRFSVLIRDSADVQRDLKAKGFVSSLRFDYSWGTLA